MSVPSVSFFPEHLFLTLLCIERKRSERTGASFALGLLDVSRLPDASPLCDAVCSQMRATDMAGWYREGSVIGIIFTTLNGTPLPLTRATLLSKIEDALSLTSTKIPVTLRFFPQDTSQDFYPDLFATRSRSTFHTMKRAIDIAGSLSALIFLSPVFLAIAVLIKLSSPGPVFFRQKRLGLLGRQFKFLKFRSMYTGNDPGIHKKYVANLIQGRKKHEAVYKIQNDPRVTPIGRFLRKSSLDELPQFLNVLKGEMSLVGPRPPIQYEMDKYSIWHKRRVLEVKPGITGLWQVMGRSRTTFDEMVRLDIRYINEQSLWLDFKILLQTPRAILTADGAY